MISKTSLAPGLYVAATPIGNLGDMSARLEEVLAQVDLVLCEDTRVTGRLLQALSIKTKTKPYHDHNGQAVRPAILEALSAGGTMALVSDAGTPLIADPGYKLVQEARQAGIPIFAIPGPCALIAALSIAGVPTDRFSFQGFLPAKQGARQTHLKELIGRTETLIFYETGPRLSASLADIAHILGDIPVIIARELTKHYEEVVEGSATPLSNRYKDNPPKGEIVLILPAREGALPSLEEADPLMDQALKTMRLKEAAAHVATETGLKKRDLYQRWLPKND
ncbi:MAG: 16S rRNA (cytidine(1402)-2'-O)-methyltransferase [Pseudomonadota bacterium]